MHRVLEGQGLKVLKGQLNSIRAREAPPNNTVKEATMYNGVTATSLDMEFGHSEMAVTLTPLKPYSYFSIGCPTGASLADIPAEVMVTVPFIKGKECILLKEK
ncbi:hypothetical protein E2C01_062263 [Portunus trituberculatus]|uniref:Uncharacterized protein n=1 Tax=Portunus trituberculatus TaxID=210409 RepID=A0A5B7HAG8_PORTR|nr:hypothetical protein [Portunus trituberculatus]